MKLGDYEVSSNICPECGKEIKELRYCRSVTEQGSLILGYKGECDYQMSEDEWDDEKFGEFYCPECSCTLTTLIDEAEEFVLEFCNDDDDDEDDEEDAEDD